MKGFNSIFLLQSTIKHKRYSKERTETDVIYNIPGYVIMRLKIEFNFRSNNSASRMQCQDLNQLTTNKRPVLN